MNNIVLIGMPGCGKSTIGVVLAKALGYHFIDSDLLIQERENRLLNEIIEEEGPERFNQIENEINLSICTNKAVIATGGSAIYGKEAMEHFRDMGVVVYIKLPYSQIKDRLGSLTERGISMKKGETLKMLYHERAPLYEQYAHIIVNVERLTIRDSMILIKDKYKGYLNLDEQR